MFFLVWTIHIFLCLILIGLVLLQQGKGADMGAAFGGGGSNSLFGAAGAATILVKATTTIAIGFMVTSILLVRLYAAGGTSSSVSIDPLKGSALEKELEKKVDTSVVATTESVGKVDTVQPSSAATADTAKTQDSVPPKAPGVN